MADTFAGGEKPGTLYRKEGLAKNCDLWNVDIWPTRHKRFKKTDCTVVCGIDRKKMSPFEGVEILDRQTGYPGLM